MNMTKTKLLKWMNVVALLLMLAINALANVLPIGGNTTGEVSAAYPTLFAPAPVTFAIWGIIYALMVLFALYQLDLRGTSVEAEAMRDAVGPWFIVSSALNIAWMLSWHFRMIAVSMVFMVALLVSLIAINMRMNYDEDWGLTGKVSVAGFQVYLGWITAATIANASVLFVQLQWDGFGFSPEFWTIAVLMVGAVLGAAFSLAGDMPFATLAVMWAYGGIVLRHVSVDGFQMSYPLIIAVAIGAVIAMFGAILLNRFMLAQTKEEREWERALAAE